MQFTRYIKTLCLLSIIFIGLYIFSVYETPTSVSAQALCKPTTINFGDKLPSGFTYSETECSDLDAAIGYCCVQGITTAGLTPSECVSGAKGSPGKCSAAPEDICAVGDEVCKSNALYICKAASSGNFFSNSGTACTDDELISCLSYSPQENTCVFKGQTTRDECDQIPSGSNYDACVNKMNQAQQEQVLTDLEIAQIYGTYYCHGNGAPGTCADRLGQIQICRNGYWSDPTSHEASTICPNYIEEEVPVANGSCQFGGQEYTQGHKLCSGFREYISCQENGSFSSIKKCAEGLICVNNKGCCTDSSCSNGVVEAQVTVSSEEVQKEVIPANNTQPTTGVVTITQQELAQRYGTFECDGGFQPGSCQDRGTSVIQVCRNGVWWNATGNECKTPIKVVDTIDISETEAVETTIIIDSADEESTSPDILPVEIVETTDVIEEQIAIGTNVACGLFRLIGVDACADVSIRTSNYDSDIDYRCFSRGDCRACTKGDDNSSCEKLSSVDACGTKCGAESDPDLTNTGPVTIVDVISNGISIISNNVSNFIEQIVTIFDEEQDAQQEAQQEEVIIPDEQDEDVIDETEQEIESVSQTVTKSQQGIFNVDYNSRQTIQVNGRGVAQAILDQQGNQVVVNGQPAYLVDGVNFGVAGQNFDPVYNSEGDLIGVVGDLSVQDYYSTGSQADLQGGPWYDIVAFDDEPQIIGEQKVKVSNFDYAANNGGTDGAYRTMISAEIGGVWRIVSMEYRSSDGGLISRYVYGGGELNSILSNVDEARANETL